mmetsp:Transcript_19497/g.27199  ORF Transcript_19497/g.27199 Transcript_19497/m.27199 type:complete len:227 (-) Transcript_19497:136-816(-)
MILTFVRVAWMMYSKKLPVEICIAQIATRRPKIYPAAYLWQLVLYEQYLGIQPPSIPWNRTERPEFEHNFLFNLLKKAVHIRKSVSQEGISILKEKYISLARQTAGVNEEENGESRRQRLNEEFESSLKQLKAPPCDYCCQPLQRTSATNISRQYCKQTDLRLLTCLRCRFVALPPYGTHVFEVDYGRGQFQYRMDKFRLPEQIVFQLRGPERTRHPFAIGGLFDK